MRHALTYLRYALTTVAVVCLGTWATVKVYALVSTARNEAELERLVHERRDDFTLLAHEKRLEAQLQPSDGTLLGRIDIPRVGVSAVILQGSGERWLEQAAGHIPGTALPASDGNAALAGHRDSVFSGLKGIRLGDSIEVTTPSRTRLYRVDAIRIVDPGDVAVLAPSGSPRLTLITCYPFRYIGSAPRRFVVEARAVLSGAGAVVVPPRPPVAARLTATSRWEPSPGERRNAVRSRRYPAAAVGGARLPAERALTDVPPTSSQHPPKVSWLRRLFHLGPKRPGRR